MNSLFENQAEAEECGKFCRLALQADEVASKRALAAYTLRFGQAETGERLLAQAQALLEKEDILGERKSEEILLQRLKRHSEQV